MKEKRSLFGKKDANTNSENSQQEKLSNTYYRSIIDLPLRHFITCAVDNNLYALVIGPNKPSDLELQLAWADIQQEYQDALGDNEGKLYLSLLKEITLTQGRLTLIETIVRVLSQIHSADLCKQLNKLCNTSFKFDPADEEKYLSELQRCINRSRSLKINIDLKTAQFEAIQKKFEAKGEKVSREYFASILITLSDHAKYLIDDSITVFDYAERLRRYNSHVELSKK